MLRPSGLQTGLRSSPVKEVSCRYSWVAVLKVHTSRVTLLVWCLR